jgi:hypothetical protein
LKTYTKEAITPPAFPKAICIAIPTPRFVAPPTLFPFHITMIGIIGYLKSRLVVKWDQGSSAAAYTPDAAKKVPMYWAAGTEEERRRMYPTIATLQEDARYLEKLVFWFAEKNIENSHSTLSMLVTKVAASKGADAAKNIRWLGEFHVSVWGARICITVYIPQ